MSLELESLESKACRSQGIPVPAKSGAGRQLAMALQPNGQALTLKGPSVQRTAAEGALVAFSLA